MAISAGAVWEMRASGTANSSGGFVPGGGGTDYSQQDSPQYTGTDLASTNGTTAPSTVTSATHSFTAADVGNTLRITAGTSWTTGIYQIVSVSAGAATLDRAVGSAATLTAGTYFVGGAFNASIGTVLSAIIQPGNKVYVTGTHVAVPTTNFNTVSGTSALPIVFEGYQTTRGDSPTGANRPSITFLTTTGSWTFANGYRVSNMQFTGKPNGGVINMTGSNATIVNCKVVHNNLSVVNNYAINLSGTGASAINCEAISIKGQAISIGATSTSVHNCYIHDSDIGIDLTVASVAVTITNNIIESCTTAAIRAGSPATSLIQNNTLYGSERKTGTGILNTTAWAGLKLFNNLVYGFATGIQLVDTTSIRFGEGNMLYNNTTDTVNWTLSPTDTTGINPAFVSTGQIFGSSATSSGTTFTDSGANFSAVVDNRDYVNILSGTGVTAGQYLITAHTTTTLTLDQTAGTTGSNIAYQLTTGRNFSVSPSGSKIGWPLTNPSTATAPVFRPDVGGVGADGGTYTDPGIANVKIGTAYQFKSVAKTGLYDGSDRWSDPGIANVRSATAYKANSTTSNRTGSAAIPAAADVRLGTAVDATAGLLNLPAQSDVKSGVTYDNGTKTGSFAGGISTDPGIANVRAGTAYQINSVDKTGTLDLPPPSVVLTGYQYDGATKTGTLASGGADVQAIVNGILNEALSGHTTAGTVGAQLNNVALASAVTALDTKVVNVTALVL